MTLVVRNTFLHYSQQEDSLHNARSNSAPPMCRLMKRDTGDSDSEQVSTTCDTTLELDASTDSDVSDAVSCTSSKEHAEISPATPNCESHCDDEPPRRKSTREHRQCPPVDAHQQLEQMSQTVMDIWSKLRAVESSMKGDGIVARPCAEMQKPALQLPTRFIGRSFANQKLDVKAAPFIPSCQAGEVQSVLGSVKQMLMQSQGVSSVEVHLGPAGTLATVSIRLDSSISSNGIIADTKRAFLESAGNSLSTYILGYEAEPFEDDGNGAGFATALASMPASWECSACWDTYTMGSCPRRKTCKWQHPGKKELQPVRVVVSTGTKNHSK